MKSAAIIWGFLIFISTALSASTYHLHKKVSLLETEVKSETNLTDTQVLALIDQRYVTRKKQKARELLLNLMGKYELAPTNTVNNRRLYGNENAQFTMQMFYDAECPYCRKEHPELKKIVDNSKGLINWELLHFPLRRHNPVAAIEAQAIECSAEVYDNRTAWVLIDRFNTLSEGNGKGIGDIPEFVRTFGLNGSLMRNCLSSDNHKAKINNNYEYGKSLGITGTPAVLLINNRTQRTHLLRKSSSAEQILNTIQTTIMN